tara:strand:- start:1179 stop:1595 length:417 start_codon:yes stop_codon:yes gene_type:complete
MRTVVAVTGNRYTRMCRNTIKGETCPYGKKCQYAHNARTMTDARRRYPSHVCSTVEEVHWLKSQANSISSSTPPDEVGALLNYQEAKPYVLASLMRLGSVRANVLYARLTAEDLLALTHMFLRETEAARSRPCVVVAW